MFSAHRTNRFTLYRKISLALSRRLKNKRDKYSRVCDCAVKIDRFMYIFFFFLHHHHHHHRAKQQTSKTIQLHIPCEFQPRQQLWRKCIDIHKYIYNIKTMCISISLSIFFSLFVSFYLLHAVSVIFLRKLVGNTK